MIYLIASIFSSTMILALFRLLDRSQAVTRHAICLSYLAAALTGVLFFQTAGLHFSDSWFYLAALEGAAFYIVFRLIGVTTQVCGVAVASIATKMSVVIPVAMGLILLGESVHIYKTLGIALGVISVLLAAGDRVSVNNWLLPIAAFFGTGLIDASFKMFQVWGLEDASIASFTVTIFIFAFATSLAHHLILPNRSINRSSVIYGVLLGCANFGSAFFIMKALSTSSMESSVLYPLNHFGVVISSTVVAVVLFREALGVMAGFALALALAAIVLLAMATM